jgi:hypothetical protein
MLTRIGPEPSAVHLWFFKACCRWRVRTVELALRLVPLRNPQMQVLPDQLMRLSADGF